MKESRITKDEVEKLSRGEPTRGKHGNRRVPHRLTQKERTVFEAAKINGYLVIPRTGTRENLVNIYTKWCEACEIAVDIRKKQADST
jgi:hypothetical protein